MARLSSHATRLLRLQAAITAALPPSLARSARVANIRSGKLVIHADNGAVAAKLRQLAPRLANQILFDAAEVTGIDIRVQGRTAIAVKREATIPNRIGDKSKRGLTLLETSLPQGSRLRAALARLIERG